jgi:bacterial/archaeal transporter family-2 protein
MEITLLFLPLALLAGALLTVQASANLQLSKQTGNPFVASTLQLAVGTGALAALAAAAGVRGALGLLPDVAWWHLLGGLGSAIYITSAILLFPRLGAVVSVGLFIAGQMLTSVALDAFGFLGVVPRPLSIGDALGSLAVIGGAATIVRAQDAGASSGQRRVPGRLQWVMLALVGGAVLPVQGAVNALLRGDLQSPVAAGLISFAVATAAMGVLLVPILRLQNGARPNFGALAMVPWWGWLGGMCGAFYVTTVFTAIPVIGAAVVVGVTVAGQQVASVFFDRYGLMRLPRRPVTATRLAGVALLLAGVASIQVA